MTVQSAYREYAPPRSLSSSIICFWTHAVEGVADSPYSQSVLPDGCTDIVWFRDGPSVVAGPATRAVDADLRSGDRLLGVRFFPGEAQRYLGASLDQLRDRKVSLHDLWGTSAPDFESLCRGYELDAFVFDRIEAELARREQRSGCANGLVQAAVHWLSRKPEGRIANLAHRLDVSERQLHRHFIRTVGYGPKQFQKVVRLQRFLEFHTGALLAGRLAEIAADLGYADQAHMCREIRSLSGRSPSELAGHIGSALTMSDLFNPPPASTANTG